MPDPDRGTPADTDDRADAAELCAAGCQDPARVARAARSAPPAGHVVRAAEMLRALGDPTRLRIAAALAREELCVCDLAALVGLSQPTVSHSLRTLRQLRLVRFRKAGKVVYYALDDAHVAGVIAEMLRHAAEEAPAGDAAARRPAATRGPRSAAVAR
jgi:DNA-binding transcriptional ArsR family regulator